MRCTGFDQSFVYQLGPLNFYLNAVGFVKVVLYTKSVSKQSSFNLVKSATRACMPIMSWCQSCPFRAKVCKSQVLFRCDRCNVNYCAMCFCVYTACMPKLSPTHDILRKRLLAKAGLIDVKPKLSYKDLAKSEWSPKFEQLMRNRLIMGALRYGLLHAPGKPQYDRIASIVKRLNVYKETGNTEHLVDAANLCLMEFEEGKHPKKHFAAHDDGIHVQTK